MLSRAEVLLVLGNIPSVMYCMLCCPEKTPGTGVQQERAYKVDALKWSNKLRVKTRLCCNVQASADASLGNAGTQGDAGNVLGSPPVTIPDPSTPAAVPPGHTVGSLGTGADLGSPDQPGVEQTPQAKEPSSQPAVNLELLRGQHQLEQVRTCGQLTSSQAQSLTRCIAELE